jgi:hypothetical protein
MTFAEAPGPAGPADPLPGLVRSLRVSRQLSMPAATADGVLIARFDDPSHLPWGGRVRYVTLVSGKPWAQERVKRQKGRTKCALRT